jgi:DNA polymerase-3 subunit alpha
MESKFIHLHTHSHYSLLDGLTKLEEMVSIAKKNNMNSIALTDHGNMYGAIEFYKLCKKNNIKPIIGVEAYMAPGRRDDKSPTETGTKKYYHLILLAKNLTGYKNLMRLVSISNLEGYYYKPRMDKEILKEYNEGLIALSACMGGELAQSVLKNENLEKAESIIKEYKDIFGEENYFIEVQSHPHIDRDKELRDKLILLGEKTNTKVVATQDSHYPCHEDHEAHKTLLAINTGADTKADTKFEFSDDDFSLIDEKTALEYFSDSKETVYNTKIVSDLCEDYEIELGKAFFPEYKIDSGRTAEEELRYLTYKGLGDKKINKTDEIINRIEKELSVINSKGYPSYFLVVADLIKFARDNNILTNTRGSAAGSLVSYLTGITTINPMVYLLPFERFLNPERPSLPDIDMDYADKRRDEVIQYAKRKYGDDRVAQIGTFGTMMAKGSVRDVARALGYPYQTGDRIASMIPLGSQGFPMTIDHAMEIVPEFKKAYKTESDTKKIIDLAKKVEGCVRHISVHAAGIVIAPRPLYEFTPIQHDPKGGGIITQYDMYNIEEAGLPKFDFLGIRNLSILERAIFLVEQTEKKKIDLYNIPLDDKKTYEMLTRGETTGLFQLNGGGMTKALMDLKPSNIHDINAMIALYRPGPMATIEEYIARKHGKKKITYYHSKMEKFLKDSYGLLVYQDDLLYTAIELAGYSWGEVDKFRKAVGKKIPEEMAKQHIYFVEGCQNHSGMNKKDAEFIWTLFEPFQGYGFNKAHAASYGAVAYQTAYMKANFPVEYMTAVLSAESGDNEKIATIVRDCSRMNIDVLPPSIENSYGDFTVIQNKPLNDKNGVIRFGLYTIKNLGVEISDFIIKERKENGKYKNLTDFLVRVQHKNFNKKSLEALIQSGALDLFGDRGILFTNVERMLDFNKNINRNVGQDSLFGDFSEMSVNSFSLIEGELIDQKTKLSWEKELLGLYITDHPLNQYKEQIEKSGVHIENIKEEYGENRPVVFAGIIEKHKPIMTKNNDKMAVLQILDFTGTIEAIVFPKTMKTINEDDIKEDTCIAIKGRVSIKSDQKSILIEAIKKL